MKKIILVFTVLLSVFMVSACSINESSNDKVVVVTTLFPQYDMVRSLAGDKVDLILTLPFGVSAHTYEPTPSTIIDILNADLLIYSSDLLEPWVKDFLDANDTGNLRIINLSDYVILIEGIHTNHGHDDNDQHRIDPHYWSDPLNDKLMINIISHKLEDLLIDDIDEIREQKNDYLEALDIFHDQFIDLENHRTVDTIMHGGHRAIGYFVDRYNLIYVNPYEGFSTDAEPTPSKIAYMIDLMETNEISYLYSEMLLSQIVSNTIQEQTGAEILYIYSMGNLSKDDFDNGLTFLDMMEHNLIQYQIGLGYDESNQIH